MRVHGKTNYQKRPTGYRMQTYRRSVAHHRIALILSALGWIKRGPFYVPGKRRSR